MASNRPEATFGSSVSVWKNSTGRSVTIKPPQYKDKVTGEWKTASGWNVQEAAWLAVCVSKAVDWCLTRRTTEDQLKFSQEPSPNEYGTPSQGEQPTGDAPF